MKDSNVEVDFTKRIDELNNSLSIALDINDKYQRESVALKGKVRVAEGETSIVKAVGMNSPEMRALRSQVEELKKDNIELKRDNTILAHDVATLNNRLNDMDPLPGLRKKGF